MYSRIFSSLKETISCNNVYFDVRKWMGAIEREPWPRIYRDRLSTKMLMSNIRLIVTKEIMKFLFLPIKILNRDTKKQGIQGKHFKKSTIVYSPIPSVERSWAEPGGPWRLASGLMSSGWSARTCALPASTVGALSGLNTVSLSRLATSAW